MLLREVTLNEFNEFAENHEYANFHQTFNYALLKSEKGYEYEMIGYFDNDNKMLAAALVLVKLVDGYLYAYVPEGFLIDYTDESLLQSFTDDLYKYYKKEQISFIKINPRIVIGEINPKNGVVKYNENLRLCQRFDRCGYERLESNMNFEAILPRVGAIVDLDEYDFNKLKKNTKNKIRKGIRKGLTFERADSIELNTLNEFIKRKRNKDDFYYNDYYNIFKRDDSIDFFLVSIDYNKYILNSQNAYDNEQIKNEQINQKVQAKPGTRNINKKMNSDKTLLAYKDDISIASKKLNEKTKEYIAGALVVKHKDKITILINGYDKKFKTFAPNYYLFFGILEYYKGQYKYADLNGITADFSKNNKYYGLNQFKLGFNPKVYEYIGEYDLIINPKVYNHLVKKGLLDSEYNN